MSGRTVTLKGNPLELEGPELKVGDTAPEVSLGKNLVEDVALGSFPGPRIYSVVPSVDTPVCALQTKRFNEEALKMPSCTFITISADLPVALARFCGAESVDPEKVICLSDHKEMAFGKAFGTLVPALRIDCRAVFVVDKEGVIRYAEYVPEIAEHPQYEAVMQCAKSLQ